MKLVMAAVDEDNGVIYVDRRGFVIKYDLSMFAAACLNPKYWEDAELEQMPDETKLSDMLVKHGVI